MIRVLLVPSSDYVGHPFPQRHNQIFERLHKISDFEVHVARFKLFDEIKLNSNLIVHDFICLVEQLTYEESISGILHGLILF